MSKKFSDISSIIKDAKKTFVTALKIELILQTTVNIKLRLLQFLKSAQDDTRHA